MQRQSWRKTEQRGEGTLVQVNRLLVLGELGCEEQVKTLAERVQDGTKKPQVLVSLLATAV